MRKVIIAVLITIVLVCGVLIIDHSMRTQQISEGTNQESSEGLKSLPSDTKLTDFSTKKQVGFQQFAGHVVLVNFWASWCEACMEEMPSIEKLYDQLKGKGFEVLAINVDDDPQKVVPQIVQKLHLTFPIYTSQGGAAESAFNVVAIPFTVVADKQQKIVFSESGEKDWSSPKVIEDISKLLKPI